MSPVHDMDAPLVPLSVMVCFSELIPGLVEFLGNEVKRVSVVVSHL
jgi:hypothetical protein